MTNEYREMSRKPGTEAACSGWDNGDCTGTPYCPPRCPRFVDSRGEPVLIVPFEEEDFESLVSMYEALAGSTRTSGLPPGTREETVAWLDGLTERGWNLLARADEAVVGHVGVVPTTAGAVEFVLFVADAYHGRGIGTELLKQLVASADARGHDAVQLTVDRNNRPAISLYEYLSFEVTERDVTTVAMRLSLEKPIADEVQRPPAER